MRGFALGRIGIALVVSVGIVALLPASAFGQTADLAVDKTDSADPVTVGSQFTYTIAVSNLGPDAATAVAVEDMLPNEVDFISATPSQGTCSLQGAKKVDCALGALANGGSASVAILVRAANDGDASNTASVSGTPADPVKANDSDTETTKIQDATVGVLCAGVQVSIFGTAGPDQLVGTKKRDVIAGLGGDDVITGLEGNDVLCGGRGNDSINGGAGSDVVKGGGGADRIRGADGNDSLFGNGDDDNLGGGVGDDALKGGRGTDRCRGGPGRDTRRGCE